MSKDKSLALLKAGTMPERYMRNLGTIGLEGQLKMLNARIAVIGSGGLGGLVVELLTRMGAGYIRVIDGDTFALHNLNRQVLSSEHNIGQSKVLAAAKRAAEINGDTEIEAVSNMLTQANAKELISSCQVVVDALDSIGDRLTLAQAARENNIPLVHAAIAGFTGQVMTVFPDDKGIEAIYRNANSNKGVEVTLGNPAATPAIAAALEVQEAVKIITGVGEPLRNKLLYFDTEYNSFEILQL
ncbi:HesA/MoeB/ThiF family protein [Sporomusa sp.]|uniref:HesA/MoeB/ThiF family protein n=1 Tax=Sporomusa sp. TaxID=2078658 RepID=UPI002BF8D8EE|nr:HesA/MoeB/ThiF family protein [Sporomusa sp.]HWR42713.1 HesA/MoeB/ThiF family protein [Sporomusa sp.]